MKNCIKILVFSLISSATLSCEDDSVAPTNAYVSFEKPSNFPEVTYDFSENQFTQQKFELGKRLFYEGGLSSDGSISCGSCHNQSHAFTHHGHNLSDGVGGAIGTRNTQPIQNLAFMKDFTWDGAIRHLDLQPLIPIESDVEMNETIENVLLKLQKDKSYVTQFNLNFEKKNSEKHIINLRTLTQSLSQFMNALVSSNSRYDKYIRGEALETAYSNDEINGLAVFNKKCAQCHAGDLFTDQSYRNNGLTASNKFPDELGRGRVTGEDLGTASKDYYKFKVPSLRNIWVTYPYMHDGRFSTLDRVFEHYDNGVKETKNLDPILKQNGAIGIPLTREDKRLLKVFLKSLTDDTFINDERFLEN